MSLIKIIAQQCLEPVRVGLAELVENRLPLSYHLVKVRVGRIIPPVIILAVAVAWSLRILQQPFQLQLLGRIHHLHCPAASHRHTSVEIVSDYSLSVGTAHRCDFQHSVGSLGPVQGTRHRILQDLDISYVKRVESHERI